MSTISELKPVEDFYPLLNRLMEFMSFDDALEMTINNLHYMPGQINIQELLRCDPADVSTDEIERLIAKSNERRAEEKRMWDLMGLID